MTRRAPLAAAALALALAAALALAGCPASETTVCAGGGLCPAGLACVEDDARGPAVCGAAGGFVDGNRCYLCVLASCGDGVLDSGEACDDGNRVSGDGCPATCAAACGDGVRDPGEACDDSNVVDDDGCSATCATSASTWVRLGDQPPPRTDGAMAYDARRGRIVLYGGRDVATGLALGDTWEWDGVTWTARPTPGGSPGARVAHAMAYDAARGRVVLFGGVGHDDTWEWDGLAWNARLTPTAPPPRGFAAMTYDAARRQIVLFGGCDSDLAFMCELLGDTWIWDGTAWTQRTPAPAPPPRAAAAMAFDPRRGLAVMVGGYRNGGPSREVWTWDGTTWSPAGDGPTPARHGAAITYDTRRGRLVVFGGAGSYRVPRLTDTWEWDGARWQRVDALDVPPGGFPALAYDVGRGGLLLYDVTTADAIATWRGDGVTWRPLRTPAAPAGRTSAAIAFADDVGVLVMFGGGTSVPLGPPPAPLGETWLRSGTTWTATSAAVQPSARRGAALARDPGGGLVLFGGDLGGAPSDDLWQWREGWFAPAAGARPAARSYAAMALDEARGQVVLFGGIVGTNPSTASDETWEWNGTTWTLRHPATTPPARYGHALAYDRERRRIVMVGGGDEATWEWDGIDWTRARPATSPPPRRGGGLAYDPVRRRTVLFGGCTELDPIMLACLPPALDDLWEWDGQGWARVAAIGGPGPRGFHAMTYDGARGRVVVFGGIGDLLPPLAPEPHADTWEWDGATWTEPATAWTPPARGGAALAFDRARGRAILFGGATVSPTAAPVTRADGWELDGGAWRARPTVARPAERQQAAIAFDPGRDRTILFGGDGGGPTLERLGDTWSWDGARWQPLAPLHAPTPRSRAAIASDPVEGAIVLFGGDGGRLGEVVPLGDTWRWDGADWTRRVTPTAPSPRAGAAMAYDPARDRFVLFGGAADGRALVDTWEWDRSTWTERHPATVPPPRADHGLVYDDGRRSVVMFGGGDGATWEWDGLDWHRLMPTAAPPARTAAAMTYDPRLGRVVMFGGHDAGSRAFADTWLFGERGRGESCTSGFDGNDNGLVGCADPSCAGACATCGDGACDPLDDCRACPADCGACDECGDLRCDDGESRASCPGDCGG